MREPSNLTYEFGPFQLEPAERRLLRDGKPVSLTPKAFDTLVMLIERAGHLVEKEELISELWPDSFVEEANVAQHVWTIRKTLGEAANGGPFIETVPKKGFRFVAPVAKCQRDQESLIRATVGTPPTSISMRASFDDHLVRQLRRHQKVVVVIALGTLLILTFALLGFYGIISRNPSKSRAALKIVPFTSFPGQKRSAVFSPDGKQIAFAWNGEKGDDFNIYVKLIGEGRPLQLTTNPAPDQNPSWSPDGRFIAFVRVFENENVLLTIPALGGSERRVISFRGRPYAMWSTDGKHFLINSTDSSDDLSVISLVTIESGEIQKLSVPHGPSNGDRGGWFSPDGKWIAFIRSLNFAVEDIYVVPVSGGEARRLTNDGLEIHGLDWTSDGREIVFSSNRGGPFGLWRASISGGPPEPVAGVGENASLPSISHEGNQLAYVSSRFDWEIWRAPGSNAPAKLGTPARLIASTRKDAQPEYSPEGKRIAFVSDRSGSFEIWMCDSEASNPVQLTHLEGGDSGTARWSPDGRQLAFDARAKGSSEIYSIAVDGGSARQLTSESAADITPLWSKDGRWVFFGSDRGGDWQIWKVPATGGDAIPVTKNGGIVPLAVLAGDVYYARNGGVIGKKNETGVWKVPLEGGDESRVFDRGVAGQLVVTAEGIYFVDDQSSSGASSEIDFYSFANKRTTKLTQVVTSGYIWGLSASPDGKWLLYTEAIQLDNDIMLVENFQ